MIRSLLLLVIGVVAVGFSVRVYWTRETRVPQAQGLAALRAGVLLLILALIWDPLLPGTAGRSGERWVLLDASLSMAVGEVDGLSPWERALAATREESGPVLLFGDEVRPFDPASPGLAADRTSRLGPALRAAIEGGAGSLILISDLRLDDPLEIELALQAFPVPVEVIDVGVPLRNAGIIELSIPRAFGSRDSISGEVLVSAEGVAGDTVMVEIRVDGEALIAVALELQDSAPQSIPFRIGRPDTDVPAVSIVARVMLDDDGFDADDSRSAMVQLSARDRPLVLVSLRPDWESRFLLPVLEQVTGLQGVGYLKLGADRWLPVAAPSAVQGAIISTPTDSVREAVQRAELLVIHGAGNAIPEWVITAASTAGKLILIADAPAGAALVGVDLVEGTPGSSWYVDAELPTSPVMAELAGMRTEPLPPLEGLLPASRPGADPRVALTALREGRGDPAGILFLGSDGDRRWALAPARGFWRWAMREGDGRNAYRRLWSAAAGWVLKGQGTVQRGVRPVEQVVATRAPVRWRVPGDSIHLVVSSDDVPVLDTILFSAGALEMTTAGLSSGSYRWRAELIGVEGSDEEGTLEVEPRSTEVLRPRWALPEAPLADGVGQDETPLGRGLRTHALPYLLLLGLLFGEWVLRRRRGLR